MIDREREYTDALDRLEDLAEEYDEGECRLLREAIEIARCARRLVKDRTVLEIHAAFGAPGDFGYDTPIGDALAALYRSGS